MTPNRLTRRTFMSAAVAASVLAMTAGHAAAADKIKVARCVRYPEPPLFL